MKNKSLLFSLAFVLFFSILVFSSCCAEAGPAGSMLNTGEFVNNSMRRLSAGEEEDHWAQTANVKAVRMADSLPDGFVPSWGNTVSTADSEKPVYIFFDNTDDAGIIYFYTESDRILMNPDCSYLFAYFPSLTDISGVIDWDASHVTTMYAMFANAKSLPDALALRNWDTSNVTDMQFLFAGANSLMFIDVSNWDTGKVTSMRGTFQVGDSWRANGQLREIFGLGSLDVSNVTDMTSMFYGAGLMTSYDIADWNVSKVESMNHMFCDNKNLRSLDLSRWNVSSVKTLYCMFDDCHSLLTIGDVSHWNTASLIDAGSWLNDAIAFVGDNTGTLDLSGWDTHNMKSAGEMFLGTKIRTIDISGWTFESMTNEPWEGAGRGIYYEYGNADKELCGFGRMFGTMWKLQNVFISRESLDSLNAAVNRGVNCQNMWEGSTISDFTVR